MGVPTVASQDQQHLCSARTQVQSLAGPQHSGLKDPALLQLRLRSDPLARNSICCRAAKKKEKEKKHHQIVNDNYFWVMAPLVIFIFVSLSLYVPSSITKYNVIIRKKAWKNKVVFLSKQRIFYIRQYKHIRNYIIYTYKKVKSKGILILFGSVC